VTVRVHQFLPALSPRDAIGAHTLAIQRVLTDAGIAGSIHAAEIHRELRHRARSYHDYRPRPGDVLLYHAAIGCALGDWMAARPERLVLDYHNITPPEFFEAWAPETALLLAQGRAQLTKLAPRATLGMGDSAFNASELDRLGCPRTTVVPIFIDPSSWGALDERRRDELLASKRGTDWLFVGRVAANKAHHDIIRAFAAYRRVWDPHARLFLVGGVTSEYQYVLDRLVAHLGVADAVTFTGSVPDAVLGAHYAAADVFVCLSDHEGFCVPLIEAMWWGLPVVAYAATAVPETVAGAGVLLEHKEPALVAAAVDHVVHDDALRVALVAAGHARVADFAPARTATTLLDALASIESVAA
jgi:glycosyltransferase involved in cell wall biosynthesis